MGAKVIWNDLETILQFLSSDLFLGKLHAVQPPMMLSTEPQIPDSQAIMKEKKQYGY